MIKPTDKTIDMIIEHGFSVRELINKTLPQINMLGISRSPDTNSLNTAEPEPPPWQGEWDNSDS